MKNKWLSAAVVIGAFNSSAANLNVVCCVSSAAPFKMHL